MVYDWRKGPPVPGQPWTTEQVLRHEVSEIHGKRIPDDVGGVELNRQLNGLDSAALCISGGGIRSATFALGMIQALAANPRKPDGDPADPSRSLLGRFNYLSTVSGGGYIGSWLTAWLGRRPFPEVVRQLSGRPDGPDVEPSPIEDLRRDSNYLTPQVGIASVDTWAAGAMVVRNLFLIWGLVLTILGTLVLVLKLGFSILATIPTSEAVYGNLGLLVFILLTGVGLVLLGQRFTLVNYAGGPGSANQARFWSHGVAITLLGALLWTAWLATPLGQILMLLPFWFLGPAMGIGGLVLFTASYLLATFTGLPLKVHKGLTLAKWSLAGVAYGVFLAAGILLLGGVEYRPLRFLLVALLGPGWMVAAQLTAETVFVALTSRASRSDAEREWLARSAGCYAFCGIVWTLTATLVLLGSRLTDELFHEAGQLWEMATAGGFVTTAALTLLAGSSSKTPAQGAPDSKIGQALTIIQSIGGPVFFIILLVLVSGLVDAVVLGGSLLDLLLGPSRDAREEASALSVLIFGTSPPYTEYRPTLKPLSVALLLTAFAGWGVSRAVNINRFSLHDLYRNRLVRAYLGATHRDRKPNPFTGFDMADNPPIWKIWPGRGGKGAGATHKRLYHVLNMTLNLVSTRNLAWQQRKAMSFVVTPRHAGAADLEPVTDRQGQPLDYHGAYRPSDEYGGNTGITLGTAMAVSGAAANPNMGYNSSPSVTLLLALFNVRLGWWLGNPGPQGQGTWRHSGPKNAATPWLAEAFGLTTADRPYVNLSDGGHFENLGLYEMVRRRCRFIVCSDAGFDPGFTFADLGNAVRKISIDLGVPIRFYGLELMQPRPAGRAMLDNAPYHAIGVIDYRSADGEAAKPGYILYIKPSYHGTEGAGIRAYAMSNPAFPHDSTADQWFDEAQFESYRSLGFEIVDGLFHAATKALGEQAGLDEILPYLADMARQKAGEHDAVLDHTKPRGPAAAEAGLPD